MSVGMTSGERIDGEYRHVVALMADIVGSSEIAEELGAEKSFLLNRRMMAALTAAAERHGGHIINYVGDGIVAIFGAPVASETASLDACRAALTMLEGLLRERDVLERDFGRAPDIRIGVASGEVLVLSPEGSGQTDASGSALNLAARLQEVAQPATIVIGDDVRADLGGIARISEIGRVALKGYDGPRALYRLDGLEDAQSSYAIRRKRASSKLVERDAELAEIVSWAKRSDESSPSICAIEGPPGIGKSRLVDAVRSALKSDMKVRFGNCAMDRSSEALMPVIEVLRSEAGWRIGEPFSDLEETARGFFADGREASKAFVEALAGRISGGGMADDHQAAFALRRDVVSSLTSLAAGKDRLVVIEDVHWLDPLSSDVLLDVAQSAVPGLRILVTTRPGQAPDWMSDQQLVRKVVPKALSRNAVSTIAADLLGETDLDSDLIDLVSTRSEGNPFFAEEILRHVRQVGGVRAESIGSIQNIVFSRFDRLHNEDKALLRLAATLGRRFDVETILDASGAGNVTLDGFVARCGGLIERAPGVSGGRLWFAHVLIRDVIYGSVPETEKPALHLAVGHALVSAEDKGDLASGAIADHLELGGRGAEALIYHRRAARVQLRQYALKSCDARMARAFAIIDANPEDCPEELLSELLEIWSRCLDLIGDFLRLKDIVPRYIERLPKGTARNYCLSLLSKSLGHQAFFDEALEIGGRAIAEAKETKDDLGLAFARVVRMRNLMDAGREDPGEMEMLFEATHEAAQSEEDFYLTTVRHYTMLAWWRRMGRFGRAREMSNELFDRSVERGDARGMAHGSWSKALISRFEQDAEATQIASQISMDHAIPGTSDHMVAEALHHTAQLEGGLAHDPDVFLPLTEICTQTGNLPLRNALVIQRAVSFLRVGRIKEGWREFQKAKAFIADTALREQINFLRLVECEVLLAMAGVLPRKEAGPKPSLSDVLFVIGQRFGARNRAADLLRDIHAECAASGTAGFVVARVKIAEAVLAGKRRRDVAVKKFDEAARIMKDEGCLREVDRINWLRETVL